MLDKSDVIERVRQYADILRGHLDIEQVILFGSYTKDTATEDSDIDVAVVTDIEYENWLEVSANLWKWRRDVDSIIEPHLMYSGYDRSGFLEEIRRTGVLIYERQSA